MLGRYLKSRLRSIAVLLLFSGVFALVFWLCELPLDAVSYALLICAVIGAAVLVMDYLRFRGRCALLERLLSRAEDAATALPVPGDEIEAGYQALLRQLRALRLADDLARREKYAELTDYYTLWAHQVKTPLAAMRLILQDRDGAEDEELRCELRRVEQYVEMVLCYIRLDSDSTDYLIRRRKLGEIIGGELRAASGQFIRGKIALEYEEIETAVLTDGKWLGFVIGQILSNALKYTPSGGRIAIYMEGDVLCIRDSGVGIPAEDLPRVTESGFTGINGRETNGSSGLGLYLCRRILARLGHGFEIRSERGQGTEVRIDLSESELDVR